MREATVLVWDRFVRLFHWALLLLILLTFFSHGGLLSVHRFAGYAIGGLIAARLVWGFVGPPHARFVSFVPTPRSLAQYLAKSFRGKAPRSLGHNPAGGAMVVALLIVLISLTATGVMLDTNSYRDYRPLHAWHDGLSDVLLVLALIHVLGVLFTSVRDRENLVLAMLTGRKRK